MSDKAKQLECVAQEIRSVLLSQPRDMTIPSLLSDYRAMVGRSLPFIEFGYSSPDEFLRSIPDVVSMSWSKRYNSYMLRAVADETTKHIEKLVSKQKVGKSTARSAHRMAPAAPPPRFTKTYTTRTFTKAYLTAYVKNEIYSVAKKFKNGLTLPNFLTAFRAEYGKDLVYKNYGFYTLEDCLNSIPEIFLRLEYSELRVYPIIEKPAAEDTSYVYQDSSSSVNRNLHNDKENKPRNSLTEPFSGNSGRGKTMNSLDDFSSPEEHSSSFGITPALKEQFKQVMKKNPQGMWVSSFPAALWELTGYNLDHHKLGYYNLIDLFSEMPEIFRIEVVNDCKDDWMLFDAKNPVETAKPKEGSKWKSQYETQGTQTSKDIFSVVSNVRLLLQASREGVSLKDFRGLYEANCGEQFNLNDFGFDSLLTFLDNIADRVPLKIDYTKEPKVYYKKESPSDSVSDRTSPHLELPSNVPSDAVVGCTDYQLQNIPENLNPEQFFPVYLSAAVDPSHMYLQLHGEDTSVRLGNLMDHLEFFYCKKESEHYRMPPHYIMSGSVCAAVWPGDGHWHRIRICSVPSSDSVVAYFVDYGSKERIPSHDLRFLRKQFIELPAQAIRSHLSRLKPAHGDQWDSSAKDFMIASFGMKPLMACRTDSPVLEESLSVVLCDVSGDSDVFLNDILVSKGFAEFATDEIVENKDTLPGNEHSFTGAEERFVPVNNQRRQQLTIQQMPVLPRDVAENPVYLPRSNPSSIKNYENISVSTNPVKNSSRNLSSSKLGAVGSSIVSDLQGVEINRRMVKPSTESSRTQATASIPEPGFSSSGVGVHQSTPYQVSHGSDSDVFESDEEIDDDDNPEVQSISKRYVKRFNLDDGFNKVHMVVLNDTPYMSSGDITYLLWNHDDPDFVRRKLRIKEIHIPNTTVKEVGSEQLFHQLERFQVRGVKTDATGNHYITLFPFKNVVDILNIFGHPSTAVRDIIDNELFGFNPLDSFWKTISEEEFEENLSTEANREKEQKTSLYELKASLQALKFRKQMLKKQLYSSSTNPSLCHEIEETEAHCLEIERHIKELQIKLIAYQREKLYD